MSKCAQKATKTGNKGATKKVKGLPGLERHQNVHVHPQSIVTAMIPVKMRSTSSPGNHVKRHDLHDRSLRTKLSSPGNHVKKHDLHKLRSPRMKLLKMLTWEMSQRR